MSARIHSLTVALLLLVAAPVLVLANSESGAASGAEPPTPDTPPAVFSPLTVADLTNGLDCEKIEILLLTPEVSEATFVDGTPGPAGRQGGRIPMRDPDNPDHVIGQYSFIINFLTEFDAATGDIGCLTPGSYVFDTGDQITFLADCNTRPFLTITGGLGRYFGAKGFIEFMIPAPGGFTHSIYVCEHDD